MSRAVLGRARTKAKSALARSPRQLAELVAALDAAADTLSPIEADEIWAQLLALARALKRGGHPRPKSPRRPPPPAPGQLDLVDALTAGSCDQAPFV
ncbi:hypothetical protein CFB82_41430 [Burkholderia sp. HI2714]|nr:hypothetical protein CFB82_41430 [Burkholderia sp. HI2714]